MWSLETATYAPDRVRDAVRPLFVERADGEDQPVPERAEDQIERGAGLQLGELSEFHSPVEQLGESGPPPHDKAVTHQGRQLGVGRRLGRQRPQDALGWRIR